MSQWLSGSTGAVYSHDKCLFTQWLSVPTVAVYFHSGSLFSQWLSIPTVAILTVALCSHDGGQPFTSMCTISIYSCRTTAAASLPQPLIFIVCIPSIQLFSSCSSPHSLDIWNLLLVIFLCHLAYGGWWMYYWSSDRNRSINRLFNRIIPTIELISILISPKKLGKKLMTSENNLSPHQKIVKNVTSPSKPYANKNVVPIFGGSKIFYMFVIFVQWWALIYG